MSNKQDTNRSSLVPSSNRDLTTQSPGLVKRGVELAGIILAELDATPLTLSFEGGEGLAIPIFHRNTVIPAQKTLVFSTTADGQTQIKVHLLQGERLFAADNRTLAHLVVDGILPAPCGVSQTELTFDIDCNGILSIQAKDVSTGRPQKVTIRASSGVSNEEAERMVKEAERHAKDDRDIWQ